MNKAPKKYSDKHQLLSFNQRGIKRPPKPQPEIVEETPVPVVEEKENLPLHKYWRKYWKNPVFMFWYLWYRFIKPNKKKQ